MYHICRVVFQDPDKDINNVIKILFVSDINYYIYMLFRATTKQF